MTNENSIKFRGTLNTDEYVNQYWDSDTIINKVNLVYLILFPHIYYSFFIQLSLTPM